MVRRLNTIGSTSTPMKNGNAHQTFRGDERRNGRQHIVSWQTIWWDSLGTFLAIVTSTFCTTGEWIYSNTICLPISRRSSRHKSNSTNETMARRSFDLICSMTDNKKYYDYVLNDFSNSIETNTPRPENVIVMGKGGVGKSFLIRAMEHGIWQLMMARYRRDEYPNVRTAVKL